MAPERRVDNLITRTHDATAMLRMHAVVMEEARAAYSSLRLRYYGASAALLSAAPLSAYLGYEYAYLSTQLAGGVGSFVGLLAALAAAQGHIALTAKREEMLSDAGLDALFSSAHAMEVSERDEFALSLWRRVQPQLRTALTTIGIGSLERIPAEDIAALEEILHEKVPDMRRTISDVAHGAAGADGFEPWGKPPPPPSPPAEAPPAGT